MDTKASRVAKAMAIFLVNAVSAPTLPTTKTRKAIIHLEFKRPVTLPKSMRRSRRVKKIFTLYLPDYLFSFCCPKQLTKGFVITKYFSELFLGLFICLFPFGKTKECCVSGGKKKIFPNKLSTGARFTTERQGFIRQDFIHNRLASAATSESMRK